MQGLPFLLLPLSPVLFDASFSMAAKVEKLSTTYLEHPLESTSGSFDSLTLPALTPEEETKAWRKVDIRLMPILALLYLFSFLDRGTSITFPTVFCPVSDPIS